MTAMRKPPMRKPPQMSLAQAAKHRALQQAYMQQATAPAQQGLGVQALGSPFPTTTSINTWGSAWVSIAPGTNTVATSTATTAMTLGNSMMNQLYSAQHLSAMDSALVRDALKLMGEVFVADGEPCKITLPDGGVLEVEADGSYRIEDRDAKVIYRANRVRDFNSFINASDKLEGFINFCKTVGVKQGEMLDIPIRHFIAWLIIEAALADGEPRPQLSLVPDLRKITTPRCRCGRFISRKMAARKIAFCRPMCLEREMAEAA